MLVRSVLPSLLILAILSQTVSPVEASFTDVSPDNPYATSIEFLENSAILQGNPDGSLGWERILNRAELTALVIRAARIQPQATDRNCFPDVQEQWFAGVVCASKSRGIVSGYADGTFGPGDQVTAGQAAKIMLNALTDQQFQELSQAHSFIRAHDLFSLDLDSESPLRRGEAGERLYRIITGALMTPKHLDQLDSEGNLFNPETDTHRDYSLGSPRYLPFDRARYESSLGQRPIVLFFWASWCPLCRRSNQLIEDVFVQLNGNVLIFKINYDTEQALRQNYEITYQDTFIALDETGQEVTRRNGVKTLEEIQGLLDAATRSTP